jgi:cell division protein FtsA
MLSKVIHARLVEIIDQVYVEVKNYGHEEGKKKLIAGIVLTGGGSQLKHIKQLFEYETGMDTRIGFPNEHLAKGDRTDLESPMYATAIGLLMKGVEFNERNPQRPSVVEHTIEAHSPINKTIDEMDNATDDVAVATETKTESITDPKESFFDKWVKGFMNFLANED